MNEIYTYHLTMDDIYDAEDGEFYPTKALAILLLEEVIFCNSFWYKSGWPIEAKEKTNLFVNYNDVFFWGVSDAEGFSYSDIEDIYKHWIEDKIWGAIVWCIKHRKVKPQEAVYHQLKKNSNWNIDEIVNNFEN